MTALKLVDYENVPRHSALEDRVYEVGRASKAANTLRMYAGAWDDFYHWCLLRDLQALPCTPMTLAMYLVDSADKGASISWVHLHRAAVLYQHRQYDLNLDGKDRRLVEAMSGLTRSLPKHAFNRGPKDPLTAEDVRLMLAVMGDDKADVRDRALILLGFHGGFRRSELATIHVEHVSIEEAGLRIRLPRSKTDQTGQGYEKALPASSDRRLCPKTAYIKWLEVSGIRKGGVFRGIYRGGRIRESPISDFGIVSILKARCEAAGIDSSRVGGHSLRSGLATQMAENGVDAVSIANQLGHSNLDQTRAYIRKVDPLKNHPNKNIL